ncbi:hypothetical protein GH714_034084 [Hevea brasiliensis]|uniref:Pentatricopeptide repeat-containing protein n=1 Tax=Hevea brasiliensis TaxID=3981 RepID=A0A6A6LMP2_HEVBR|nr:hypothetical protein GH714_034084 [Hevea brasiliensis]
MAVIVETQREKMDDIEENVANAGHFHQRRNQQSLPCQSDKGEEEGLELLVLGCDGDHTFGNLPYAHKVFDRICRPNTFMWNTMIRGYADSTKPEQALILYHQMLCDSVPHNAYTFPFLLKACSTLSALKETQQIHAHMIKLGFGSDVYATNSLLHAYVTSGFIKSAQVLFDRIPQPDVVSWNSMIDGYMKHGYIEIANQIFRDMPARNAISYTIMISGYVQAGLDKDALHLFQEMQIAGVKPDKVELASVLSACANFGALDQGRWIHAYINKNGIQVDPILGCVLIDIYAGLVDEGKSLFDSMEKVYSLIPTEHYGCMVDLLGRAGLLKEAKDLIERMPVKPNAVIWGALLNACRIHGNIELGKQIGKFLIEVDPDHGGRHIHLANIHAATREWDVAAEARRHMKEYGVSKIPGCSTIILDGAVHGFLAGDGSHPQMKEIYCMWYNIAEQLRQEGYKTATQKSIT